LGIRGFPFSNRGTAELLADGHRLTHPLHPAVERGLGVRRVPAALLGKGDHACLVVDAARLRVTGQLGVVLQRNAVDRLPNRVVRRHRTRRRPTEHRSVDRPGALHVYHPVTLWLLRKRLLRLLRCLLRLIEKSH
jgi:hypothetical protein